MLHHGEVGRVQTNNTNLCFHQLFWHFLCFFYQKICVFIIFIYFFRIKYQISATNINESETGIGGPKLPLELYVTYQIE